MENLMAKCWYLTGQRFGKLTVIGFSHKTSETHWLCHCDCGGQSIVMRHNLVSGKTKGCGCLKWKSRNGRTFSTPSVVPEYQSWAHMIRRTSPSAKPRDLKNYVERGITVCDRWKNGEDGKTGFQCFFDDVGSKPTPSHSIDRIDNDGNYEPSNCKWSTPKEQSLNQRKTILLDYKGRTYHLEEAAKMFASVSTRQVYQRIRSGWTIDEALETPNVRNGRPEAKTRRPLLGRST